MSTKKIREAADEYLSDKTGEQWREIPGWPKYQASNTGRVRRAPDTIPSHYAGRVKSQYTLEGSRVPKVNLIDGDDCHPHAVAKLVCMAFHGPPPPGYEVVRLNMQPGDCRAENLEWKPKEEALGYRNKLGSKLNLNQVRYIRHRHEQGDTYRDIAEDYPVSWTTIADICRRDTWDID